MCWEPTDDDVCVLGEVFVDVDVGSVLAAGEAETDEVELNRHTDLVVDPVLGMPKRSGLERLQDAVDNETGAYFWKMAESTTWKTEALPP